MANSLDNYSVDELEEALYRKKRELRQQRLRRLKGQGRLVEIAGFPPPAPTPPPLTRPQASATGALRRYTLNSEEPPAEGSPTPSLWAINWRWIGNQLLLLVEIGAVVGFLAVLGAMFASVQELNQEAATSQQEQVAGVILVPTSTPEPLIRPVVLPSGHRPPIDGRPPEEGEEGNIPDHLLPYLDAYVPPPVPTPGPQQPRQIQIGTIEVNAPIVQGDDWDQLKKGVGHHIGSALPGEKGNLVLSAHNDIYGQIFRHLDRLEAGDEVVVSTGRESFTYVVNEIKVVEPTAVEVMDPTNHASLTLISCYPYLINNKRIVVTADLVTP